MPIPNRGLPELVAVARDVTERKKAEERIRDSEERYRSLVETSSAAVATTDSMGQFTFVNEAGCKMSGYSREELIGRVFTDILHPDDKQKVLDIFSRAMQGVKTPVMEFRAIHKDGHTVWCYSNPTILTRDNEIIGFSAILIDMTQQRNMEEQLQRAGRLAAVGELAAGVAHELNNPLAAIQGFAQLLTARDDVDEILKKDLQTMYTEAKRATTITKNLLSFSLKQDSNKRLVSINEAVEKTLELRIHQLKINNVEVAVQLQPDLPMSMVDFDQMREVFMNIINNAEQAMTESHGRGKLIIRTRRSGEMVQVIFIDNGPGIPKENLTKIFDPFFTTKEVGKGTGLGLSMCYGILQAHGGHIYVRSDLGKGATFTVEIPVASEDKPVANQIDLTKGQGGPALKWFNS
jgi:two-component system NtrC family sensor kinase